MLGTADWLTATQWPLGAALSRLTNELEKQHKPTNRRGTKREHLSRYQVRSVAPVVNIRRRLEGLHVNTVTGVPESRERGFSLTVKTPDCRSGRCGFESHRPRLLT